jgi:His-Xaa-Ser system protein HxsD
MAPARPVGAEPGPAGSVRPAELEPQPAERKRRHLRQAKETEVTEAAGIPPLTLTFDQATVDLDALQRSAYALAREATADIRVTGATFTVTLFPRATGTTQADLAELAHRYRTEVNDQVLRGRIARETEPLRNLVFALAFSETGLVEAESASLDVNDSGDAPR